MSLRSSLVPRFLGMVALAIPFALVAIFSVATFRKPDFDPLWSYISLLSLGSTRWLGMLFFAVSAVGTVAFAGALRQLGSGRMINAASWVLLVGSTCLVLLIFIDIDHVSGIWTLKRVVHWSLVGVLASSFAVAAVLVSRHIYQLPAFQGVVQFSILLASAAVVLAGGLAFKYQNGFVALLERICLAAGFMWVEVVCLRLLKLPRLAEVSNG